MVRLEILMVEDNRGDVVLLDEAFDRPGASHCIHVVCDGVEALEFLRRQGAHAHAPRPDVIVLDLKLPRKGGREVLEDILPDPDLRCTPIVVLSSSESELELVRDLHLPMGLCIAKPSTFAGYVEIAGIIISHGRRQAENAPSPAP
ncbi:MAG: response regulator [Planctomycetota bacterium]|nr:response regulator [Planctomycetota bacterium]